MRALTIGVLVLSGLWFGYWVIASRGLDSGVERWLEGLRTDGVAIGWSDVAVHGFPNRFELTISDPVIGDPALAEWRADFFQMLTLSYAPYHLIAVWPDSQTLITPLQTLTLTNAPARASVHFRPVPALPLDHLELVIDAGNLSSTLGWSLRFDQARFATRQRPDLTNRHELGLDVTGLTPPAPLRTANPTAEPLPETAAAFHADITVQPDIPLDRHAFSGDGPHIKQLDITEILLEWGPIRVEARGTLTRNAQGKGEGTVTIRLADWRGLVSLLRAIGAVDEPSGNTLTRALEVLETLDPDPAILDVPISFKGDRGTIAGLPLLAAPDF